MAEHLTTSILSIQSTISPPNTRCRYRNRRDDTDTAQQPAPGTQPKSGHNTCTSVFDEIYQIKACKHENKNLRVGDQGRANII